MTATLPPLSHAPAAASPSRTPARSTFGWSELRRLIFLDVLKRGGAVASAARAAGMSRASAYALRDRDGKFDRRWGAIIQSRDQKLFEAHVARVDAAALRLTGSLGRRPAAVSETRLRAPETHSTPATMTVATGLAPPTVVTA